MSDTTELPKPIPINQMTLLRLQGQLQLSTTPKVDSATRTELNVSEQQQVQDALSKVRSFLSESGHPVIIITNKDKDPANSSYVELCIEERSLTLTQANDASKLSTTYYFETQKLRVGNSPGNMGQDLEKFANKISKISDWMAEKKMDVIGKDKP